MVREVVDAGAEASGTQTRSRYAQSAKVVAKRLGGHSLTDADEDLLTGFLSSLNETNHSEACSYRTTLGHMFSYSVRVRALKPSPMNFRIQLRRTQPHKGVVAKLEQMPGVLDRFRVYRDTRRMGSGSNTEVDRVEDVLNLALGLCGLRIHEATAIFADDISGVPHSGVARWSPALLRT